MAAPDDIELMQHVDGELADHESAQVRSRLERDADARTKVEAVSQLGELVRGHLELSADDVADRRFAAMWRGVEKGLDAEQPPRGVWAAISGWFERHKSHVLTGAVSAGAVAAIALVLRPSDRDASVQNFSAPVEVLPAAMRSAPVIESLDTPDGTGMVMNFEDEGGHTTVIWVTPEDTVEGI